MERPASYSFILFTVLIGFLFFFAKPGFGDEDESAITRLFTEDSATVNTLAAYPGDIKDAALIATTTPQLITRLNDIQRRTNSQFINLVAPYPKDEQLRIWNMMCYEGLLDSTISNTMISGQALKQALKAYSNPMREEALHYTLKSYDLLLNINRVKKEFNQSFGQLIKPYPTPTQDAFRKLMRHAELLGLFYNNMLFTVRLGNIQQKNPDFLRQHLASLSLELGKQKAKDADDWKQKMKDATEARRELIQELKDFTKENRYDIDDTNLYDTVKPEQAVLVSYPYWCGHPWWVQYSPWFIYPYWYHCGFYFRQGDTIWLGPPSYFFLRWHLQNDLHLYHYPAITNACIQYYCQGQHRTVSECNGWIQQWINVHKKYFPDDFLSNDKERIVRIKEYGKFIMDFEEQVNTGILTDDQQDEFLQNHANDYPHLHMPSALPAKCPPEQSKEHAKPFQKRKLHS